MEKHYEFDEPSLLAPVAMGAPGKRTFFLVIGEKERWVRVWLEKYLLEALALAIEDFLFRASQENLNFKSGAAARNKGDAAPSGMPSAELEIDEARLDFDDGKAELGLLVHSVGPRREDGINLRCRMTEKQLKDFASRAEAVSAAGRPRCSLCGGPIDPSGHTCPKTN